jgi:phosphoenolpyruvate-protein kinase (PTS system EI component)
VIASPDREALARFQQQVSERHESWIKVRKLCHRPAITEDGTRVEVMANIGCREDAVLAAENGADGVGLYRLENLFLSRKALPTETELLVQMRSTLEPFRTRMVTLRLLDTGGDKAIPSIDLPDEPNPFLGRRGVRLLLEHPELLRTQLRTFLRIAQEQEVRILVPMVTLAEEMERVRDLADGTASELGLSTPPPIGAMIETPAAALCVSDIALHADFLSVGTNDLTQYTMVAGRENPLVDHYFQADHPAVLRLVQMICEEGVGTALSVCGELASRTDSLQTMLDLGIRRLSVAPPLVPDIKQAVRRARVDPHSRTTDVNSEGTPIQSEGINAP